MTKTRNLIAVLDDELMFCKALSRLLKTHGFDVAMFQQGDVFFAACATRLPDCVLLDLHMPEPNGFMVLERLSGRGVPVLVITGHDQPGNAECVRQLGGAGYFLKPVNEAELIKAIRAALEPATNADEPQPRAPRPGSL